MPSGRIELGDSGRNCEHRPRCAIAPRANARREIDRSLDIRSGSRRSAHVLGKHSKRVPMLLVCIAAIIVVFSFATSALASEKASSIDAAKSSRAPGTPFWCNGYVYEADGTTPWPDCVVNITNKNTGSWNLTVTDYAGFYMFDLANEMVGSVSDNDLINVTVTNESAMAIGWNEGIVPDATADYIWLDVTMNGVIPEFPMLILPVMGLALVVIAAVRYRRR